jgi:hypothetical protein
MRVRFDRYGTLSRAAHHDRLRRTVPSCEERGEPRRYFVNVAIAAHATTLQDIARNP